MTLEHHPMCALNDLPPGPECDCGGPRHESEWRVQASLPPEPDALANLRTAMAAWDDSVDWEPTGSLGRPVAYDVADAAREVLRTVDEERAKLLAAMQANLTATITESAAKAVRQAKVQQAHLDALADDAGRASMSEAEYRAHVEGVLGLPHVPRETDNAAEPPYFTVTAPPGFLPPGRMTITRTRIPGPTDEEGNTEQVDAVPLASGYTVATPEPRPNRTCNECLAGVCTAHLGGLRFAPNPAGPGIVAGDGSYAIAVPSEQEVTLLCTCGSMPSMDCAVHTGGEHPPEVQSVVQIVRTGPVNRCSHCYGVGDNHRHDCPRVGP